MKKSQKYPAIIFQFLQTLTIPKNERNYGMETDTIRLLRECNAGIKMGEDAIKQVLPHTRNEELRAALESAKNEHAVLGDEAQALLLKINADTADAHPFVRCMSAIKICGTLMINESDSKIADLMTDGCDMGIKSLHKHLNKYKHADGQSRDLAKRIIASEVELKQNISAFL